MTEADGTARFPGQKLLKYLEPTMVLIGIIGPLAIVPQLTKLWLTHSHHAPGQSLLTWGMYAGLSAIWLTYGIYVRRPAIYFGNGLSLVLNLLMIAGILVHAGLTF